MTRGFIAYTVNPPGTTPRLRRLGQFQATGTRDAIEEASRRWPGEVQEDRPMRGFLVLPGDFTTPKTD